MPFWDNPAIVSIPAAMAVMGTVALFLRRMAASQRLGHEVANQLASQHQAALQTVVDGNKSVMQDFALRMEKFADRQERLTERVTELCSTIERDIAVRRAAQKDATP